MSIQSRFSGAEISLVCVNIWPTTKTKLNFTHQDPRLKTERKAGEYVTTALIALWRQTGEYAPSEQAVTVTAIPRRPTQAVGSLFA
jgi:hypothetical protein